jgi:RNA polymerase sigma-70 factor (ECF subfamily)
MSDREQKCAADPPHQLAFQAQRGDAAAFARAIDQHRGELRRAVARRLDRSLRNRFDPSDIVQEAQLEAVRRLPEYMVRRPMPFRTWLFKTAFQRLLKLRRQATAARRDISRERRMPTSRSPAAACARVESGATPSQDLAGRERASRLHDLLPRLSSADRTVLELRALQSLSYEEVGNRLGIDAAAARKRYGRALLRLRALFMAEGLTESTL